MRPIRQRARGPILAIVGAACGEEPAFSVDASLPVGDAAADGQVAPDARAFDGGPSRTEARLRMSSRQATRPTCASTTCAKTTAALARRATQARSVVGAITATAASAWGVRHRGHLAIAAWTRTQIAVEAPGAGATSAVESATPRLAPGKHVAELDSA